MRDQPSSTEPSRSTPGRLLFHPIPQQDSPQLSASQQRITLLLSSTYRTSVVDIPDFLTILETVLSDNKNLAPLMHPEFQQLSDALRQKLEEGAEYVDRNLLNDQFLRIAEERAQESQPTSSLDLVPFCFAHPRMYRYFRAIIDGTIPAPLTHFEESLANRFRLNLAQKKLHGNHPLDACLAEIIMGNILHPTLLPEPDLRTLLSMTEGVLRPGHGLLPLAIRFSQHMLSLPNTIELDVRLKVYDALLESPEMQEKFGIETQYCRLHIMHHCFLRLFALRRMPPQLLVQRYRYEVLRSVEECEAHNRKIMQTSLRLIQIIQEESSRILHCLKTLANTQDPLFKALRTSFLRTLYGQPEGAFDTETYAEKFNTFLDGSEETKPLLVQQLYIEHSMLCRYALTAPSLNESAYVATSVLS